MPWNPSRIDSILCSLLVLFLILPLASCRSTEPGGKEDGVADSDKPSYRRTYRSERKVDIERPQWEEPATAKETAGAEKAEAPPEPLPEVNEAHAEPVVTATANPEPRESPPEKTVDQIKPPQKKKAAAAPKTPSGRSSWEDDFIQDMQGIIDQKKRRTGMTADLANHFPVADEIQLGEAVAARILSGTPERDDKALWEYVSFVGLSLVEVSSRNDLAYHFAVLDDPENINAFAAPGGFVFITSGALMFCDNEAELAAILAHELGHVGLKHGLRALDQAKYRVMMELMVLEMDAGREKFFEGGGIMTERQKEIEAELSDIADACYEQTRNPYNQALEIEADREAVKLLAAAGYNPYAAITLLERLDQKTGDEPLFTKALRSHPDPSERIKVLKAAIRDLGLRNKGRLSRDRFLKRCGP